MDRLPLLGYFPFYLDEKTESYDVDLVEGIDNLRKFIEAVDI
jgi:hypothetical protein